MNIESKHFDESESELGLFERSTTVSGGGSRPSAGEKTIGGGGVRPNSSMEFIAVDVRRFVGKSMANHLGSPLR